MYLISSRYMSNESTRAADKYTHFAVQLQGPISIDGSHLAMKGVKCE